MAEWYNCTGVEYRRQTKDVAGEVAMVRRTGGGMVIVPESSTCTAGDRRKTKPETSENCVVKSLREIRSFDTLDRDVAPMR